MKYMGTIKNFDATLNTVEYPALIFEFIVGCILGVISFISRANDPLEWMLIFKVLGFMVALYLVGFSSIRIIRKWMK